MYFWKSFRCDYFGLNRRDEKTHNFLSHYQMGGRLPIEDKPLKKTHFYKNLQIYYITFLEHGPHCNFYDSQEKVSVFLKIRLFQELTLGRLALNLSLLLSIDNLLLQLSLLRLPIAEFGKQMCMMACILMIISK